MDILVFSEKWIVLFNLFIKWVMNPLNAFFLRYVCANLRPKLLQSVVDSENTVTPILCFGYSDV